MELILKMSMEVAIVKIARISLTTIPNNETQFNASSHGPTDQIAKMLVAYLTYHPELMKKTLKGILDKVFQED